MASRYRRRRIDDDDMDDDATAVGDGDRSSDEPSAKARPLTAPLPGPDESPLPRGRSSLPRRGVVIDSDDSGDSDDNAHAEGRGPHTTPPRRFQAGTAPGVLDAAVASRTQVACSGSRAGPS